MNIIRTGLERLSRGVVLQRALPAKCGGARIYVTPDSRLKYWRPDLETADPNLLNAATELVRTGDVVWDVGANVGLFAFAAAGLAGSSGYVLAIEPDAWLATLLHRSAAHSPSAAAPVHVLPVAVSDEPSISHLTIAKRGRSSNYLQFGHSQTGGARAGQSTLCITLDWLLHVSPHPNVLKIDVEGLEMKVLKGAKEVLARTRPRILCEVGPENSLEFTDLILQLGYTLFDADKPIGQRRELDLAPFNTIAYPPPEEPKRA